MKSVRKITLVLLVLAILTGVFPAPSYALNAWESKRYTSWSAFQGSPYYSVMDTSNSYLVSRLMESFKVYAVGSTFTSGSSAPKVSPDGSGSVSLGATQCMGYAHWMYYVFFGQTPSGIGYANLKSSTTYTAAALKSMLSAAHAPMGTHIRFNGSSSSAGHSVVLLGYDSSGLVFIQGNYNGSNGICVAYSDWDTFMNGMKAKYGETKYYIETPTILNGGSSPSYSSQYASASVVSNLIHESILGENLLSLDVGDSVDLFFASNSSAKKDSNGLSLRSGLYEGSWRLEYPDDNVRIDNLYDPESGELIGCTITALKSGSNLLTLRTKLNLTDSVRIEVADDTHGAKLIYNQRSIYRAIKATNVKSLPYANSDTINSQTLLSYSPGALVTIISAHKNEYGNIWYALEDGGFIYSNDFEFVCHAYRPAQYSGTLPPSQLSVGEQFKIEATIDASDTIVEIDVVIKDEDTGATVFGSYNNLRIDDFDFTKTHYNLDKLGVNQDLDFSQLPPGNYAYVVRVAYGYYDDLECLFDLSYDLKYDGIIYQPFTVVDDFYDELGYYVVYEVVNSSGQKVRAAADRSSTVLKTLPKGTRYTVDLSTLSVDAVANGYLWAKALLANNQIGWVAVSNPTVCKPVVNGQMEDYVFMRGAVYDDKLYMVYMGQCTWSEAKAKVSALGEGWHLATITNPSEQNYVSELVSLYGGTCWLGGEYVDGAWQWVTGEPFDYANWDSGEPSNPSVDRFLGIYGNSTQTQYATNGKWNNFNDANTADTVNGFVAEIDLEPVDDEYDDYTYVRESGVMVVSSSAMFDIGDGETMVSAEHYGITEDCPIYYYGFWQSIDGRKTYSTEYGVVDSEYVTKKLFTFGGYTSWTIKPGEVLDGKLNIVSMSNDVQFADWIQLTLVDSSSYSFADVLYRTEKTALPVSLDTAEAIGRLNYPEGNYALTTIIHITYKGIEYSFNFSMYFNIVAPDRVVYEVVYKSGLRLRDSASLSGKLVTLMPCNDQFVADLSSTVVADGYTWAKVTYGEYTGWTAISESSYCVQVTGVSAVSLYYEDYLHLKVGDQAVNPVVGLDGIIGYHPAITYTSNSSCISIDDNNVITAIAPGSAIVTVQAENAITSFEVVVSPCGNENILSLPVRIRKVEAEAFMNDSTITKVIINGYNGVEIGSKAFANCQNLDYVCMSRNVASISADAFDNSMVTFVCPRGSAAHWFALDHNIPVILCPD